MKKHLKKSLFLSQGDVNAFFGLVVDNMTQLVIMAGILVNVFQFPKELVYFKMIPGSAIGVFAGNLAYTVMAVQLAKKTGRDDITAMPLGIDTPSLFAFLFGVLGPAHLATGDPVLAWKIGMATIVLVGLAKTVGAFFGPMIRAAVPPTALLGPIAGVALLLISFFPATKIFHDPIAGFVALAVILVCFIGKIAFPFRIPAALAAVGLGTLLSYATRFLGGGLPLPELGQRLSDIRFVLPLPLPLPTLDFIEGLAYTAPYLPLALPFALVVIIGGIDVTESAKSVGDDYDTRSILMTSGLSTMLSGVCGGVVQTTPNIGHPAYKEMGGRAGYTLGTALFIGFGGMLGYLGLMVDLLPEAALSPILIFVGLEITAQTFLTAPKRHYQAVVFSFIPAIAALVLIELQGLLGNLRLSPADLTGQTASHFELVVLIANGFIISSLIWGAMLCLIIDHQLKRAAGFCVLAAGLTLFGIIHSPYPDGRLFFPGQSDSGMPLMLFMAYLAMAVFLVLLSPKVRAIEKN